MFSSRRVSVLEKRLFEPEHRVRVVVISIDLAVTRRTIEGDCFAEMVARIQTNSRTSKIEGDSFESP